MLCQGFFLDPVGKWSHVRAEKAMRCLPLTSTSLPLSATRRLTAYPFRAAIAMCEDSWKAWYPSGKHCISTKQKFWSVTDYARGCPLTLINMLSVRMLIERPLLLKMLCLCRRSFKR